MAKLLKRVQPFSWNAVVVSFDFTQGVPLEVNLAGYLRNPRGYAITYSLSSGNLPTGVTHSAGVVSYNGVAGAGSSSVVFSAVSGSAEATVTATVQIVGTNQAPYWDAGTPSQLNGTESAIVQMGGYAIDPEGGTRTFSITTGGTNGYEINASTGALKLGTVSQSLALRVSDGSLYDEHEIAVTIAPGTVVAGSTFEEFAADTPFYASWEGEYTGFVNLGLGSLVRGSHTGATCRPTVKTTPIYSGSRSLRFTIPGGAASASTYRSEVEFGLPMMECNLANYENVEHYIGFALYLDPAWPLGEVTGGGNPMRSVLFQQHTYSGQPGLSPLWGLRTSAGTYRLTTETGVGDLDVLVASDLADDLGAWRRWVFHVKYNSASSGWLRIYRGIGAGALQLLYDTGNRNTVPSGTTKLGYYKFGNYTSARELNSGSTRTSYVDVARFASSVSGGSLAIVDPASY